MSRIIKRASYPIFLLVTCAFLIFLVLLLTIHFQRMISELILSDGVTNITDRSTFSLMASASVNGHGYLNTQHGIGHIYGPITSAYAYTLAQLLGVQLTPQLARIILLITMLGSIAAAGIFYYAKIVYRYGKLSAVSVLLFIALIFAIAYSFLLRTPYGQGELHPIFLLVPELLVVHYLLYKRPSWDNLSTYLILLVVALLLWFTNMPYVVTLCAFAPSFLDKISKRQITYFLVTIALFCLFIFIVYYFDPSLLFWSVLLPLSQNSNPDAALWNLFLYVDEIFLFLFASILFSPTLAQHLPRYTLARRLFLLTVLLASFVGFRKIGGGPSNLGVAYFFIVISIGLGLIELWLDRSDTSWSKLPLVFVLILYPYAVQEVGSSILYVAYITERLDPYQDSQLAEILDDCENNNYHCYIDSFPSYYSQRGGDYEFEACAVWELTQSPISRTQILEEILERIDTNYYDVIMLRMGVDHFAWGQRCLPDEFIEAVTREYREVELIPHVNNTELGVTVFASPQLDLSFSESLAP